MLGLHIRAEGEMCRTGFNFYPLKHWRTSIGFIFYCSYFAFWLRWANHVKHLYCNWERIKE